jgi:hypothetical protein
MRDAIHLLSDDDAPCDEPPPLLVIPLVLPPSSCGPADKRAPRLLTGPCSLGSWTVTEQGRDSVSEAGNKRSNAGKARKQRGHNSWAQESSAANHCRARRHCGLGRSQERRCGGRCSGACRCTVGHAGALSRGEPR